MWAYKRLADYARESEPSSFDELRRRVGDDFLSGTIDRANYDGLLVEILSAEMRSLLGDAAAGVELQRLLGDLLDKP